jgi:hypothetical protein
VIVHPAHGGDAGVLHVSLVGAPAAQAHFGGVMHVTGPPTPAETACAVQRAISGDAHVTEHAPPHGAGPGSEHVVVVTTPQLERWLIDPPIVDALSSRLAASTGFHDVPS